MLNHPEEGRGWRQGRVIRDLIVLLGSSEVGAFQILDMYIF
jgi:hypothetical protein